MSPGTGFIKTHNESLRVRDRVLELIDADKIETRFQPIFNMSDGTVHAYEALSRIPNSEPFSGIEDLFRSAIRTGVVSSLDHHCRTNALRVAAGCGLGPTGALLFLNVCPETIQDPAYRSGMTDEAAEAWGIDKNRIVLELTENVAVKNWSLFASAIDTYRDRGYSIAIDDFGAGYGGLKMLTVINPDYVKIDRHFISRIDRDYTNVRLVEALVRLSAKLGFRLVAEGIESEAEMKALKALDIRLMQGYFLGMPAPGLAERRSADSPAWPTDDRFAANPVSTRCIGDFIDSMHSLPPSATINDAFNLFMDTPAMHSLPVVHKSRILGVLNRRRFFEQHVLGRYGYGIHLNAYEPIETLLEQDYVTLNALDSLIYVSRRLNIAGTGFDIDNICVVRGGAFAGTISPGALLTAMTERTIALARGANPLTGMPGNAFIQEEIETRLAEGSDFDTCYIDIDNFKPFNDHYGFELGDDAIKRLSLAMQQAAEPLNANEDVFLGHIGGDDFIAVAPPSATATLCASIMSLFAVPLEILHGPDDFRRGAYREQNRSGVSQEIPLLSLSIAVVNSVKQGIASFSHLASVACEVKKAAKAIPGNSLVYDKRISTKN